MRFTNRFPVLFTLAVATTVVSAQNFDSCGQACVNTTLSKGLCSSLNDTSCTCSNTEFQNTLGSCLSSCSSSDLAIAVQLEKETCSNSTNSSSSSSSQKASATNSATSSTQSSQSSGATTIERLPLLSAVIVITGALIGGASLL